MTTVSEIERRNFLKCENVSRETLERLDHFVTLLKKWSPKINLVAKNALESIWHRHISDSIQLITAPSGSGKRWLDIGSGGGFPGLVVAIMTAETRQYASITLVESDLRKCFFLQEAVRELGVSVTIINARIERLAPQRAQVISARALAPLPKLLGLATPHLASGGVCLFMKGRNYLSELTEAKRSWKLSYDILNSKTDPKAVILRIHEAIRV